MGLRQVAQRLTAIRSGKKADFYGRVSLLDWNSRPEIVNHIYRFWAESNSDVRDGEIFHYSDIDRYFILVSRTPVYIKQRLRYVSGIAVVANHICQLQKLVAGSPDAFGKASQVWTTQVDTRCNMLSGILDTDQMQFTVMPDGFYNVMISRLTERIYKAQPGDRIVIAGKNYKVELIDETRYTTNVYTCRVVEDNRT